MEQGTSSQPNRISFDRLTAAAIFYPTGGNGGIDLGIIDMQSLDEGIAREKVMFPIDGNVVLGYDEVVSVSPLYSIKGKQMHDAILPLVYMGSRNADIVQSSSGSATFTVSSVVLGNSYDIGARGVTLTFAKVGGVTKLLDTDYFFNPSRGIIRFPNVAAGINAGDAVVVTFSKPALTRTSITAFNNLNQLGTLQLFEMDRFNALGIPKVEASILGNISRDKGSSGDPTKTDQWQLRFAIQGQPNFYRLQS